MPIVFLWARFFSDKIVDVRAKESVFLRPRWWGETFRLFFALRNKNSLATLFSKVSFDVILDNEKAILSTVKDYCPRYKAQPHKNKLNLRK